MFIVPKRLTQFALQPITDQDLHKGVFIVGKSPTERSWRNLTFREYLIGRAYWAFCVPKPTQGLSSFLQGVVATPLIDNVPDLPLFGGRTVFSCVDALVWSEWVQQARLRHQKRRADCLRQVKCFPTHKSLTVNESVAHWQARRQRGKEKRMLGPSLIVAIKLEQVVAGQDFLNPRWVESFMGLPLGWTLVHCRATQTPRLA